MSAAARHSLPGLELGILDMMACMDHLTLAGPKPPLHSLYSSPFLRQRCRPENRLSRRVRGGRTGEAREPVWGGTTACQACAMALSTSAAAAIVASMSSSVCVLEKKSASYWLHGR